jgi:hypothetical protein
LLLGFSPQICLHCCPHRALCICICGTFLSEQTASINIHVGILLLHVTCMMCVLPCCWVLLLLQLLLLLPGPSRHMAG